MSRCVCTWMLCVWFRPQAPESLQAAKKEKHRCRKVPGSGASEIKEIQEILQSLFSHANYHTVFREVFLVVGERLDTVALVVLVDTVGSDTLLDEGIVDAVYALLGKALVDGGMN